MEDKDRAAIIELCKNTIEYRAVQMGLRFSKDDIISVDESSFGTAVFLRRFNEREVIDGNGQVVFGSDGKPLLKYDYPVWLEYKRDFNSMIDKDRFIIKYPLPRVVIAVPELICIVKKDGEIVSR